MSSDHFPAEDVSNGRGTKRRRAARPRASPTASASTSPPAPAADTNASPATATTTAPTAPAPLQFITSNTSSTSRGAEDAAARKAIRSHVMKNHFYQKKAPGGGSETAAAATAPPTPARPLQEFKGRFRLSTAAKRKSAAKKTAPAPAEASDPAAGATGAALRERSPTERTRDSKRPPDQAWDSVLMRLSMRGEQLWSEEERVHGFSAKWAEDSAEAAEPNGEEVLMMLTYGEFGIQRFEASRLDPFNALPVPGSTEVERLLWFYKAGFRLNEQPVNTTRAYLPMARYDPGLLHAILCSIAYCYSLTTGQNQSETILYHKGEALKALGDQLSGSNAKLSDTLVALITILAAFEVLLGAYDVASLHLRALSRLLPLPGTLDSLSHSDALTRGIHWVDFHLASAVRRPPLFRFQPRYSTLIPVSVQEQINDFYTPGQPGTFPVDGPELDTILRNLRALAALAAEPANAPTFPNLLYETEHALLTLPDRWRALGSLARTHHGAPMPASWISDADHAAISIAFATAAELFLLVALRRVPAGAPTIARLEDRVRVVLERREMFMVFLWNARMDALAWCLWVVGVTAGLGGRAATTRRWARFHGRIVGRVLKVAGVDDWLRWLRRVVWLDEWEAEAARFWLEIEAFGDEERADDAKRPSADDDGVIDLDEDARSEADFTGVDPIILW